MSLINDALKRVSRRTPAEAPLSDVPLQPVDASASTPQKPRALLLILVLAAAGGVAWYSFNGSTSEGIPTANAASKDKKTNLSASPSKEEKKPESMPKAALTTAAHTLQAAASRGNFSETPSGPASQPAGPDVSTSAPQPAAVAPASSPLSVKLQGIYYRQPRPSALIDGKTYYEGDRLGEGQIVSIERTRVWVERAGNKEVLSLE